MSLVMERHHLERAYRLCSLCEDVLKQTLHKQKSILLGFRLKQLHNRTFGKDFMSVLKARFLYMVSSLDYILHYFTAMLAAWLVLAASFQLNKGQLPFQTEMVNSTILSSVPYVSEISSHVATFLPVTLKYEILLTAIGTVIQYIATKPKKHGKIGIICVPFWTFTLILSCLRRWKKLETYVTLLDLSIVHICVTFMTLFVCTCNALTPRKRFATIKSHNIAKRTRVLSTSSDSSFNMSNSDEYSTSPDSSQQKRDSPENDSPFPETSQKDGAKQTHTLKPTCDFYPTTTSPLVGGNFSPFIEKSPLTARSKLEDSSHDLGLGFGNLTLGSSSWGGRRNNNIPSFETKIYAQSSSSDIFNVNSDNVRHRKKSIIRPSQFNFQKNITQSSWVAGGYWQSPVRSRIFPTSDAVPSAMTPLSRSSSQSSGFVSQSSQHGLFDGGATSLPNSRTGSICGADFDHFSALSEPVYPYATTPVYYTGARPGSFVGAPYYGAPALFLQQNAYRMIPQPPGFLPHYVAPQPVLGHAQCYYPQPTRPLGSAGIWNPAAFSPLPMKQPENCLPAPSADVLSQSSSQNSDSHVSKSENKVVSKCELVPGGRRTFVTTIQENLFLAILFFSSLLFNAFILGFVMLGNSNMLFPGMV